MKIATALTALIIGYTLPTSADVLVDSAIVKQVRIAVGEHLTAGIARVSGYPDAVCGIERGAFLPMNLKTLERLPSRGNALEIKYYLCEGNFGRKREVSGQKTTLGYEIESCRAISEREFNTCAVSDELSK